MRHVRYLTRPTPQKYLVQISRGGIAARWVGSAQPTWIEPFGVSFKCVLRADIQVGYQVKFPLGVQTPYALASPKAAFPGSPASYKSAFQGTFLVLDHHFANFRQADPESWATAFRAVLLPGSLPGGFLSVKDANGQTQRLGCGLVGWGRPISHHE
jgi:hypothetical protein